MSEFLLDLRFGVKRADGYVSDVWRASATQDGDFQLATRSITGVEAYTFEHSGACSSMHSSAESTPAALCDRDGFSWRRAATPRRGSGRAARVAWIAFPTDYLSRPGEDAAEDVLWI